MWGGENHPNFAVQRPLLLTFRQTSRRQGVCQEEVNPDRNPGRGFEGRGCIEAWRVAEAGEKVQAEERFDFENLETL